MSELIISADKILSNSVLSKEDITLHILKKKELGFNLILLGIAEKQAANVSKLIEVMDILEKDIFNKDIIASLPISQQIELHKYANELLNKSASFVKDTKDSIDWSSLEVQLASLDTLTDGNGKSIEGLKSEEDLKVFAGDLLRELGSKISNR